MSRARFLFALKYSLQFLVPLSTLQLHAIRDAESSELLQRLNIAGDCTQECAEKESQIECTCRCSDSLPYLTFDEARALVRAELAVKGNTDSEDVADWDSVCDRIDSDASLHQDFLVVAGLQTMKTAADLVNIYKKDLVKVDANGFGIGLGAVLASVVTYLQFAGDKAIVLQGLKKCANKFLTKSSDASMLGWQLQDKGKVETFLGKPCMEIRGRIFSLLGGLVATIGSAFFDTLFSTLERFMNSVSAVVVNRENPVSVTIMFIDALGVGGPWLHTVLNAMLYLSPKAGEILCGEKKTEPYFKETAAIEAVKSFVLRLVEVSTMQQQLQLARERSLAVEQCVAEHGNCDGLIEEALVDCESRLARATKGCQRFLDSSLKVRNFCGVTLGRGDRESICETYAVQSQTPPGAFVKTLDWDAFRHGLRACDVIQRIEFREGGTFSFLPQWAQNRLDIGEKIRTLNIEGPETIEQLLQEDRARVVPDNMQGREYEITWTAALIGKSLVLSKLPEVEWEDMVLVEKFMIGLLECSPAQQALITAGGDNETYRRFVG